MKSFYFGKCFGVSATGWRLDALASCRDLSSPPLTRALWHALSLLPSPNPVFQVRPLCVVPTPSLPSCNFPQLPCQLSTSHLFFRVIFSLTSLRPVLNFPASPYMALLVLFLRRNWTGEGDDWRFWHLGFQVAETLPRRPSVGLLATPSGPELRAEGQKVTWLLCTCVFRAIKVSLCSWGKGPFI